MKKFISYIFGLLTGVLLIPVAIVLGATLINVGTISTVTGVNNEFTEKYAGYNAIKFITSSDDILDEITSMKLSELEKTEAIKSAFETVEGYEIFGTKILKTEELKDKTLEEIVATKDFGDYLNIDGIKETKLGKVLGYVYNEAEGKWQTEDGGEITGSFSFGDTEIVDMSALCDSSIKTIMEDDALSNIVDIDSLTSKKLGEIMGYTYDEAKSAWVDDKGEVIQDDVEFNGAKVVDMTAMRNSTLGDLFDGEGFDSFIDLDAINNLTIGDFLGEENSICKLIGKDTKLDEIGDAMSSAMTTKTISELMNAGFIEIDTTTQGNLDTMDSMKSKSEGYWKTLTLTGLISYMAEV